MEVRLKFCNGFMMLKEIITSTNSTQRSLSTWKMRGCGMRGLKLSSWWLIKRQGLWSEVHSLTKLKLNIFGSNVETLISGLPNCTNNVSRQWESKVIKHPGRVVHCKFSAKITNWEFMFQILWKVVRIKRFPLLRNVKR